MILKKTMKRLSDLYDEYRAQGSTRINPRHVQRILDKIDRKARKTRAALEHADESAKRDKLTRKLAVMEQQRKRGEQLMDLVRDRDD